MMEKEKNLEEEILLSSEGKEKIKRLKQEYESYPVPEQLKKNIKNLTKTKGNLVSYSKIFKGIGITAAAAMAAIVILANSSKSIAAAMEKIPIIGVITKVVTFRTYENSVNDYEAKVVIPKVVIEDQKDIKGTVIDKLNKSIEEYTNELITQHETNLRDAEGLGKEALNSTYSVLVDTEQFLSIRIDTMISMASTDIFSKIYHIDKVLDKEITLKDLFKEDSNYIEIISSEIIKQMKEQMEQDEMTAYFIESEEEANVGFQKIKDEENFYINKEGKLTIVFDKYEVAPGYMGAVEFIIPMDCIKDKLSEEGMKYIKQQ